MMREKRLKQLHNRESLILYWLEGYAYGIYKSNRCEYFGGIILGGVPASGQRGWLGRWFKRKGDAATFVFGYKTARAQREEA